MQQIQNLKKNGLLVLEALQGAAAIVDAEGDFVASNKRWSDPAKGFHWFGVSPVFENYFSHCEKAVEEGNDYALKLIFGLREVLDRDRESFEMTAPISVNAVKLWFKVSVNAMEDSSGKALIVVEDISKHMLVLQELSDSKERYTQQFHYSISGIIISSQDGEIVDANPAACLILGYTKDELILGGYNLFEKKTKPVPDDSPKENNLIFVRKDGTEISVEISSVSYRSHNGEIREINTFSDNTKVKRAEKNLEEEKRFISLAANSIPGAFYVLDKKNRIIRWNHSFTEDLGYTEEELQDADALEFITEKDRKRVKAMLEDIFRSGTGHIVAEVISKQEGVRNYHLYANRFDSHGEQFIVGTGMDITGLVESEKERFKNYELLSQLFNNSPMAMVMISPRNAILKANDSFISLFGYESEEVIGENVNVLIAGENQTDAAGDLSEAVFSGKRYQEEAIRFAKNGEELSVLINTVPIVNKGEVIAVYRIYVDLTEQKKLEKQIQTSLREKDILLKEVHHRVKNNLAVMAGLLDLQIMEEENSEVAKQLNKVRNRIFSVAKIHETLYQEKDIVSIRFDKYLKTISDAQLYGDVNLHVTAGPLSLNLNQAVPFGLALNELFNLIVSDKKPESLGIKLSSEKEWVELLLEGENLNLSGLNKQVKPHSFQEKFLDIFLNQMGGELELISINNICIRFKKAEMRGSSSSLKSSSELYEPLTK
ncbi:MAG: PAS domain S-box protein [Balneolaceae bacterium]